MSIAEEYVTEAIDRAEQDLNDDIAELEDDIKSQRETTRYQNSLYHRERNHLKCLNSRKRKLLREVEKVKQMKNLVTSKKPTPLEEKSDE